MPGVLEGLHGRLSKTVAAGVRPILIAFGQPGVHIDLQLLQTDVQLLAKRYAVELLLHGAVKPLADAISLRRADFRFRVIDILDRHV